MTTERYQRLRRFERAALVVGTSALLAGAVLGWRSPEGVLIGWRLAVFACLQPALGSLIFVLIFRLTGGQWMEGLAPFLTAGVRLLPWVWLLALPLLFFPLGTKRVDAPLDRAAESSPHVDPKLRAYFSRPLLGVRAAGYAIAFFLLAAGAMRALRTTSPAELRWVGPVGLIALVFVLHLLAVDWFERLEPGWYSTGFPLVWMTAQALAGLALSVAVALLLGAKPDRYGSAERTRGLDWGNLLLASVMAWTYVAFVEWLIIWNGNLPAETAWYRHRSDGIWRAWLIALAALEFGAPFLLLLSRALKRRRTTLALIATMILAGQTGYTVWLIAPAFPGAISSAPFTLLAITTAAAALFLNRYLATARRNADVPAT